jgi:uncharacterized protein YegJ (DUF2314 family)
MKTKLADVGLRLITLLLLVQVLWFFYNFFTVTYHPALFWSQLTLTASSLGILAWLWIHPWRQTALGSLKSFVLLLRKPRQLALAELRRATDSALGVRCDTLNTTADNAIVYSPPVFYIRADGYTFLVNNAETPYISHEENTPEHVPNVRLQEVIRDHKAWLSVDLVAAPEHATTEDIYQRLGCLIAELVDDNCIGLYCPETSQLNAWHPILSSYLKGASPLQAVEELVDVPAIRVTANDTQIAEASQRANSMWTVFVNAFACRTPEQTFAVKAPFSDKNETEYMWLIVTDIDEETVSGTLDNTPIYLRNITPGDTVTVTVDQINDWLYTNKGEVVGGFTTEALTSQLAA